MDTKKIPCVGIVTVDVITRPVSALPPAGIAAPVDSVSMHVGGCAANAYHATGDIGGVYEYGCRLFRRRMENAIMMNVAREEKKADRS